MGHGSTPAAAIAPWVGEEWATADLKNRRLKRRLHAVRQPFGGHPTASIPAACGGHTEMTAAYRLFDNPKAGFQPILPPHVPATRRRIAAQPVGLLVRDTTELELPRPQQQVEGAGPLDDGSRRGVFLHPWHAFTPEGTPLGTLAAVTWTREEEVVCAQQSRQERAQVPIEQKESVRWVEMLRRAKQEAASCPDTPLICVADCEADIYELLAAAAAEPCPARKVDWLVRACQDRAVVPPEGQGSGAHLRVQVLSQPVLFTQTIHVRGRRSKVSCEKRGRRQPRESRQATMAVHALTVTLRPPWRPDRQLPAVTVNVVLVREVAPPPGEPAVEWLLLTSLPIATLAQVRQVIEYYCVRWMIEVWFHVLKGGCRVEQRRFETLERFCRAWRCM